LYLSHTLITIAPIVPAASAYGYPLEGMMEQRMVEGMMKAEDGRGDGRGW
jgi:hypothetical protein